MKLTRQQKLGVEVAIKTWLSVIFEDAQDLNEMVETLLPEVIEDIEVTADWEGYEADEINTDDVKMSLARIIRWSINL
jgi:hypothetical protein